MPQFSYQCVLPFPVEQVFGWHTRPGAFVRLTPPGLATVMHGPNDGLNPGSEITLRISTPVGAALLPHVAGGPPGLTWKVRHVDYQEGRRFVDEQLSGPFESWHHSHEFSSSGSGTRVSDTIDWNIARLVPTALVDAQLRGLCAFRESQLTHDLALLDRLAAAPVKVLIAGASGLVGRQLGALFSSAGHTVLRMVRRPAMAADEIEWDPHRRQLPAEALEGVSVVINLSGESIGGRFTAAKKSAILNSRIDATSTLALAMAQHAPNATLVQASAIGYYGARRPSELLDESSPRGRGFLADVVDAWEHAALPAAEAGVRTVFVRTGIALSGAGGALAPQVPLFLAGVGGRLASAPAALSWIGLDDLARIYVHAAFTPSLAGPVNAVGPAPTTQEGFARTLGGVLRRPAILPTPSIGPKLVLGGEGFDQLINTDQYVVSTKLAASGFTFGQPTLEAALRHALLKQAA